MGGRRISLVSLVLAELPAAALAIATAIAANQLTVTMATASLGCLANHWVAHHCGSFGGSMAVSIGR